MLPYTTRAISACRAASRIICVPWTLIAVGAERIGDDVVDVRDRGEMDDRVAAARSPPGGVAVGDVAEHRSHLGRRVVRRLREIEDHRLVAVCDQPVDDVRADEAGTAGDEHPHAIAPTTGRATGR